MTALRHTAAKHGISLVLINQYTSQTCHCGATVTHPVWKISSCSTCDKQYDRDALAADMILSRGFATRSTTQHNKAGEWVTRTAVFAVVRLKPLPKLRRVVTVSSRILVPIVAVLLCRSDLKRKETSVVSYLSLVITNLSH